jgi:GT2 family glycosyltransferase
MTHDVVICTRNRPTELETALESVAAQTRAPTTVIIVDASDDEATHALTQRWSSSGPLGSPIRYLNASPGLPAQRNLGVDISTADVVHFIDDDVVLDREYLASIAAVFERDSECQIVGVGGLVTNQPSHEPRIWWRTALLDSRRSGVILKSGANIIVTTAHELMRVQWLSGCSMSYRADVVRRLRFDEGLPGYASMEDVDFGFRAARVGKLVLEPEARLVHNTSPIERWDDSTISRAFTYRRGWFVEKNLPRWCLIPFWWSVVAGAAIHTCVALAKRDRKNLRIAVWWLQGGIDFARGIR